MPLEVLDRNVSFFVLNCGEKRLDATKVARKLLAYILRLRMPGVGKLRPNTVDSLINGETRIHGQPLLNEQLFKDRKYVRTTSNTLHTSYGPFFD